MGVQVEFAAMLVSQAIPLIVAVASLLCFLAVVADASRPWTGLPNSPGR